MNSPLAILQRKFRRTPPQCRVVHLWGVLVGVFTVVPAVALLTCMVTTQKPASAGQQREQDQRGRIRAEVSLVSVLSSVLDKNGRPALDLTAEQFEIYEEGVKQKIELAEQETQQPLDIALMIETSWSEYTDLDFETDAASRFIQKLVRPGDRLALFEFSETVSQITPFSSNVPTLQAALKHIPRGPGTNLYDAVYLGCLLYTSPSPRD